MTQQRTVEIDMDENRIEGGVKKAAGKVKETFGAATGDRDTEASGKLREVEGEGQQAYGRVVDTVRNAADKTSDLVRDASGRAMDTAREVADRTSENVRDVGGRTAEAVRDLSQNYPIQSLLVAGVFGFLCGMLIRRD
jgi:uncharacterized protein YjbJ (UPF0337 family)